MWCAPTWHQVKRGGASTRGEIGGPIVVKLFASSTAPDTDFTTTLIDEYPPSTDYPTGFEMNLTDGIIRDRYRNSPKKAEPGRAPSCPPRRSRS